MTSSASAANEATAIMAAPSIAAYLEPGQYARDKDDDELDDEALADDEHT